MTAGEVLWPLAYLTQLRIERISSFNVIAVKNGFYQGSKLAHNFLNVGLILVHGI
jgi:hypothetical protein